MIERISIENMGGVPYLSLTLDQLNVVCGTPASGKSLPLRTLRTVAGLGENVEESLTAAEGPRNDDDSKSGPDRRIRLGEFGNALRHRRQQPAAAQRGSEVTMKHDWRIVTEDIAAGGGMLADAVVCAECGDNGRILRPTMATPAENRELVWPPSDGCRGCEACNCGDGRPRHWTHDYGCPIGERSKNRELKRAMVDGRTAAGQDAR